MKVQHTTLATNHIQSVLEQDRIEERSNPTSQPSYFTTNDMNCAVEGLLFGIWYFFMVILLYDTTLQVQEISQKSTRPKWTQLYHLDNRSYSTIHPLTSPTYIMKIGEWLSLSDFFDTFSQKLIRTAHQNSHQTCNEVETSPCDQF